LFGQFVTGLADIGVHSENFVQHDNGGSRQGLGPRDIGAKRAVSALYGDAPPMVFSSDDHVQLAPFNAAAVFA
jgi:hypothetical protein